MRAWCALPLDNESARSVSATDLASLTSLIRRWPAPSSRAVANAKEFFELDFWKGPKPTPETVYRVHFGLADEREFQVRASALERWKITDSRDKLSAASELKVQAAETSQLARLVESDLLSEG
jgi:hypothetical protein